MFANPRSSNEDITMSVLSACSPKVKRASLQLNESASFIILITLSGFMSIWASDEFGSFLKVQYPHSFLHISVKGRKTFFEYVIMFLFLIELISDIKDNISPDFPFRRDIISSLYRKAIFSH